MLHRNRALAGEPYKPANDSEGSFFTQELCERCEHGPCHRLVFAHVFRPGDPYFPAEWVHNADGDPVCTAFMMRWEIKQ